MGGKDLIIGAAANAGRNNYAVAAIDFDGRILINRNSDGRWSGFQPLVGQTPEMFLSSPIVLPALAAQGN